MYCSQATFSVKKGTDRLNKLQDDQESLAVLEWLTSIDFATQQQDFIGRRQPGTGQWFLESEQYQAWIESDQQIIFCPGIPGAGKTILAAIVIEDLTKRFRNDPTIGIAYVYLNFRRHGEQTADNLIASLAKQLSRNQPSLPDCVRKIHENHKDKQSRPTSDELSSVLQTVVGIYSKVFIVVDALDECQILGGHRNRLLSELFAMQSTGKASVLATSRFLPEITERFEHENTLEIRADDEDVRNYVAGRMTDLPGFVGRSVELQEEIKDGIVNAVSGM